MKQKVRVLEHLFHLCVTYTVRMTTTQPVHTTGGNLGMNGITGTDMHTIMVEADIGVDGIGIGSIEVIVGVIHTL